MRKVKVAFFAEMLIEDLDGASRTMFQLIHRIPTHQFEFLFFCGEGPDKLLGFDCYKVPKLTIPSNKNYTLSFPGLAQQRIIQCLNSFSPDIIHIATPSLLGHFAIHYAQKLHIPVISIYHTHFISYIDYYFKKFPALIPALKKYISHKKKIFYNKCDLIYIPSTTIKNELAVFGVRTPKMQIWERGIDTNLFNPKKKDPSYIQEITGNNHPTLLFASRLVFEKNLETLFRIYHLTKQRKLAINFIVAGDGQARKACEKEMPEAIFLGHLHHETLATLYASSSIFLFPSISETYGNVVLEAMASGLPCIIAKGGGSQDLVQDGINGFCCPAHDEKVYVEHIEYLLRSPSLYKQFQLAGMEKAKKLNWENLASIYFNDLKQLGKTPYLYKLIP